MNKISVLEKIVSNVELNHMLKVHPDLKSFTNYKGDSIKLICDNNAVRLEELARELVMQTFLKDEKTIYRSENKDSSNYRADLVASIGDVQSNIIEIKETGLIKKEKLNKLVNEAFNQIRSLYVLNLKEDCFISVVIVNLSKIVDDPSLLAKYFNLTASERTDTFNIFTKYGIYIETRRFNILTNDVSDLNRWPSLPRHGDFRIKDISLSGDVKLKKIFCTIEDAIKLPCSSANSYGIKNVRDIKDPNISASKNLLILSILDTAVKAFKTFDSNKITNAGKDKEFLISESESIVYKIVQKDFDRLIVCTLNGAIIDGQNSIDSFGWIIDTVSNYEKGMALNIPDKNRYLSEYEKKLLSILTLKLGTVDNLKKFKNFLQNTELSINIEETSTSESAIAVAITKNNTMQVTANELHISKIQIPIQYLATELLDKYNINLCYPKKEMFVLTPTLVENTIDIEQLVCYLKCIHDMEHNKQLDFIKLEQAINKAKEYHLLTDRFIAEVAQNTDESKELDIKISELQTQIADLELLKKEMELEDDDDDDNAINRHLKNLRTELLERNNTKERIAVIEYELKDLDILASLIKRVCKVKNVINLYGQPNAGVDTRSKLQTVLSFMKMPKFINIVFIMSILKYKELAHSITTSELMELVDKLVNNINYLNKFNLTITGLRRNKLDLILSSMDDDSEQISIADARIKLFEV